jgi:hypothetical protein
MFTRVPPPGTPGCPVQEIATLWAPEARVPVDQTFCWRLVVELCKLTKTGEAPSTMIRAVPIVRPVVAIRSNLVPEKEISAVAGESE